MNLRPSFIAALYILSFFAAAVLLPGCAASASRLTKLQVGMTRDEVTRAIGRPRTTTARAGTEVLIYQFTDKPFGDGMIFPGTYYVQLNQGRVTGWSRDDDKDRLDRERAYRMNYGGLGGGSSGALTPLQQHQAQQSQHAHEQSLESQRALNRSIERMTPQRVDVYVR